MDDAPALEDVERWLAAWDRQGLHRTATAGDKAGVAWLAAEAASLGVAPQIEEFALERLDPVTAFLETGGARIAAIPVFDAPPTGPAGVSGRLGEAGGDGEIAVARLPPQAVYNGEFARLRRAHGPRGFVVICAGGGPGMALLNAESFRAPYGGPAVHVSAADGDAVLAAAGRGDTVRLVADSRRTPSLARNIVVRLPGRDPGAPPLVVMTPRSSWWQSTAERGGGIVCWLECLRALLAERPARPVVFTANSGHELGHLGLDDFVARRPGWEEGATWVHWGANIGAAGGSLSVMSAQDRLRERAAAALTASGQPFSLAPKSLVPSGETRDIHKKDGRYLTLVGTNRLFHQPEDRWPEAVDVAAIARIAGAAAQIVRDLARR